MPISFQCPACSYAMKAPDSMAGRRVACPKCKAAINIPREQPVFVPPPAAPEPAPDIQLNAGEMGRLLLFGLSGLFAISLIWLAVKTYTFDWRRADLDDVQTTYVGNLSGRMMSTTVTTSRADYSPFYAPVGANLAVIILFGVSFFVWKPQRNRRRPAGWHDWLPLALFGGTGFVGSVVVLLLTFLAQQGSVAQSAGPPLNDDLEPGPVIEEFLSAVADVDAGRLYTFDSSARLHVYSYPEFKLLSTHHLPGVVRHAVFDARKGLLYAAVGVYRVTGSADAKDIHIYNLRAMPLPESIKPETVLELYGPMRQLLLSGDGRSLYFVTQPELSQTFEISRIDTAQRRKTAELKISGSFAFSPDGKRFLIGANPAKESKTGRKQVGIIKICDPVTLQSKTRFLIEAEPRGLAVTDDGILFVNSAHERDHHPEMVVVDLNTKEVLARWENVEGTIHFSADGKRLYLAATSSMKSYVIPEDDALLPRVGGEVGAAGHNNPLLNNYLFTSDGKYLISNTGKTFKLAGG